MNSGGAARLADRLPWLSDESPKRSRRWSPELVAWAAVATILISGTSYRAGFESRGSSEGAKERADTSKVSLSTPYPLAPSASDANEPSRGVSDPPPTISHEQELGAASETAEPDRVPKKEVSKDRPPESIGDAPAQSAIDEASLWPVGKVEGASGRLLRVGNFGSPEEAGERWRTTLRQYPDMQRLPMRVVPMKSLRTGQIQYRIQIGTTSQTHSDELCRKLRAIEQSCTKIGADDGIGDSRM
jgi:hypothetical protein